MAKLVVSTGPLAGTSFEVIDELTIGRENATITLPDDEASRRHAVVRAASSGLVIEDQGSLNGTWVDDRRIDAPTALHGGEVLRIGETSLSVEAEPDTGATRPHARRDDAGATVMRAVPSAPVAAPADHPDPAPRRSAPAPAPAPPAPAPQAPPRRAPEPQPATASHAAAAPPAPSPSSQPVREVSAASAVAHRAPRFVRGEEQAAQPFGAFAQPAAPRRRGIATRKAGPTLLSFATIIATACALVAYFLDRT